MCLRTEEIDDVVILVTTPINMHKNWTFFILLEPISPLLKFLAWSGLGYMYYDVSWLKHFSLVWIFDGLSIIWEIYMYIYNQSSSVFPVFFQKWLFRFYLHGFSYGLVCILILSDKAVILLLLRLWLSSTWLSNPNYWFLAIEFL